MGTRHRRDEPDSWHHVMNRGIAKRTVFETQDDIRFFLSRIARAVRAGRIEVHAYCIMSTHFHLLVRSPAGELASAVQDIQNQYVRRFNRSRRRDGPLHRSRYRSKRVTTLTYRRLLVRYIDHNPVSAGLVPIASAYPHSSARAYARSRGPIWLTRSWVESSVREESSLSSYDPKEYWRAFGEAMSPALERLVCNRLDSTGGDADPLDELLSGATPRVLSWMRQKASLADGTDVGLALCDADHVQEVIRRRKRVSGGWTLESMRPETDGWRLAEVGLLRDLCGATLAVAATSVGLSVSRAWSVHRDHARCMSEDLRYAERVAELAAAILEFAHGSARTDRG